MKAILSSLLIFMVLATDLPFFEINFLKNCEKQTEIITGKHTREKKLKKEFNVSENSNLNINNSYGNIDISTWKENRVVIEVIVKTNGNDLDDVEEKLKDIDVDFSQNSSGVSARTRFSNKNKSWWKNIFDGFDNVNMEVNYIIRAPEGNNLDLNNDYGGIYIDKTNGNTKINCDYGKIDIGELNGRSNYLNFDYTRNSRIDFVTNAEISADYSAFEIGEAESLDINADYSDSRIEKVSRLEFNCDYGSMNIDKVKELKGNGDYLTTKINRIFTAANLNINYGSLSIEKVIKGASQIVINTDYAGVKLGYDPEMSFNFNAKSEYGNLSGLDELNVLKRRQENTSNEVSGYYGDPGGNAIFDIKTTYGSIKFLKN